MSLWPVNTQIIAKFIEICICFTISNIIGGIISRTFYFKRSSLIHNFILGTTNFTTQLQWRHNAHDDVSNHQPHGCFLSPLFRYRSKKTSKLRVTGFCEGNSPMMTVNLSAQRASNGESVSIWWRHHANDQTLLIINYNADLVKLIIKVGRECVITYDRKPGTDPCHNLL